MIINPIISLWIMIPLTIIVTFFVISNYTDNKRIVRLILMVLLFIVNLRIMLPNGKALAYENNLDIIFVIDSTLSMSATDIGNSRLDTVKNDVNYIMDKTTGASYAVINFDNSSYTRMVMTKDADSIAAAVDSITVIDDFYAKGTKVTVFKEELETLLKREEQHPDKKVIVYIFTDGEKTSEKEEEDLGYLKEYIDGGAILGYGTDKGIGIKIKNYYGQIEDLYYYDNNYNKVKATTKIDESNMKKISKDLGIEYIHMTSTDKINNNLKKTIKEKGKSRRDNSIYSYKDTYYFITPLIGIIFLIELYDYRKVRI